MSNSTIYADNLNIKEIKENKLPQNNAWYPNNSYNNTPFNTNIPQGGFEQGQPDFNYQQQNTQQYNPTNPNESYNNIPFNTNIPQGGFEQGQPDFNFQQPNASQYNPQNMMQNQQQNFGNEQANYNIPQQNFNNSQNAYNNSFDNYNQGYNYAPGNNSYNNTQEPYNQNYGMPQYNQNYGMPPYNQNYNMPPNPAYNNPANFPPQNANMGQNPQYNPYYENPNMNQLYNQPMPYTEDEEYNADDISDLYSDFYEFSGENSDGVTGDTNNINLEGLDINELQAKLDALRALQIPKDEFMSLEEFREKQQNDKKNKVQKRKKKLRIVGSKESISANALKEKGMFAAGAKIFKWGETRQLEE
jgi:hypothetical protein